MTVSQTTSQEIRPDAMDLLDEGQFEMITGLYEQVDQEDLTAEDHFILATAHYRQENLQAAIEHFKQAATATDTDLATKARFNLGSKYRSKFSNRNNSRNAGNSESTIDLLTATQRITESTAQDRYNLER